MKTQRGLFTILLFALHCLALGQSKNKLDIVLNFKSTLNFSEIPEEYRSSEGLLFPSILGNLQSGDGLSVACLYSQRSFYYQPGIVAGFNRYQPNARLKAIYQNLKLNSAYIGITNRLNLIRYGHSRLGPYLRLNVNLNLARLAYDGSQSTLSEVGNNESTSYSTQIQIEKKNMLFVTPSAEISAGAALMASDKIYLFLEAGISFSHYPGFYVSSPFLSKESILTAGIQYKIFKQKRFYIQ